MSATSLKSFKTAFDGRLKDVHLCLDAVKGPNAHEQLRNALIQLNELRQLTKDYELEVPKDPEARSLLRECNKTINSVKNAYAEKEAFVQRQTEREVLGDDADDDLDEETGAGKVAQHNRMLNEGRKHLGRALDYAGNTSVELERQKEKLQKARQTVGEDPTPERTHHRRPRRLGSTRRGPAAHPQQEQTSLLRRPRIRVFLPVLYCNYQAFDVRPKINKKWSL